MPRAGDHPMTAEQEAEAVRNTMIIRRRPRRSDSQPPAALFFFFKQKTAYEMVAVTGVQTCALPISAFTTLNSSVLTGSRVPYAMAQDGLFFRVADGINPRYRTPAGAIVFQAVISCLMVLTGQFEEIGRASCRERV